MSNRIALRVTHLADAADQLGLSIRIGAGGLTYFGPDDAAVIGPALTVHQKAIRPGTTGAALRHGEAVTVLSSPGQILVIKVEGDADGATWGEAHALRAIARGLSGLLTDGAIRDRAALKDGKLPTMFQTTSPYRSVGRLETVSVRTPVELHGVTIEDGDVVAMDADGFLCLSREQAEAILATAATIAEREAERDKQLVAQARPASGSKRSEGAT